jgi:hypothetical protein
MKKLITFRKRIENAATIRLINSEYQRGFMEGQHQAAMEFAECIDRLLAKHDHVAVAGRVVFDKKPES